MCRSGTDTTQCSGVEVVLRDPRGTVVRRCVQRPVGDAVPERAGGRGGGATCRDVTTGAKRREERSGRSRSRGVGRCRFVEDAVRSDATPDRSRSRPEGCGGIAFARKLGAARGAGGNGRFGLSCERWASGVAHDACVFGYGVRSGPSTSFSLAAERREKLASPSRERVRTRDAGRPDRQKPLPWRIENDFPVDGVVLADHVWPMTRPEWSVAPDGVHEALYGVWGRVPLNCSPVVPAGGGSLLGVPTGRSHLIIEVEPGSRHPPAFGRLVDTSGTGRLGTVQRRSKRSLRRAEGTSEPTDLHPPLRE